MTFYQELQLNQAGSKGVIRKSETSKEKAYHIAVYLFKIAITMVFCFCFVAAFSMIFGNDNSVVGVVVLLCLMVFKNADFGVKLKDSIGLLTVFFAVMMIGPHAANVLGAFGGMIVNMAAILLMVILGCHNPLMSNQSTIVLSYLLLYGYDVSGHSYSMRIAGLALGWILTTVVFYRHHKKMPYERTIKHVFKEFHLDSVRGQWQISLILGVPITICISELFHMPRSMWAGIAAMSAIVPFMTDMKVRVKERIIGNICGGLCFLVLYHILPPALYANIGIIGGIGVGFSVNYGWQAVFNTFGALAIATESFGLSSAIVLRVVQNIYGVVFALIFCAALAWILKKWQTREQRVHKVEI